MLFRSAQSSQVDIVYVAPGNAGTAQEPALENVAIDATNTEALLEFANDHQIDLTIVGPEAPLVNGIVDRFDAAGLTIFGPSAAAAQLEGSKTFTKDFLERHQIPTAAYASFTEIADAIDYLHKQSTPIVIKADGLAAGKGVVIAQDQSEAEQAIEAMLSGNRFGEAGHRVVIEEFLDGEEASFICIVDGEDVLPMATSQDHKARDDGDRGPNTGGMGAYSPAPVVTPELEAQIMREIILPTVQGMQAEGNRYRGFLYAGLMIGRDNRPRVLEYNCRFGDPETQPIMMRLQSDLVEHCLAACQGKLINQQANWDTRASLGIVMAARGYPDNYAKGEIISHIPGDSASGKVFHAGTQHNESGQLVTAGGRVLCAVGMGQDINEAQKTAYQIVSEIDWQTAFFRSDIGFKAL